MAQIIVADIYNDLLRRYQLMITNCDATTELLKSCLAGGDYLAAYQVLLKLELYNHQIYLFASSNCDALKFNQGILTVHYNGNKEIFDSMLTRFLREWFLIDTQKLDYFLPKNFSEYAYKIASLLDLLFFAQQESERFKIYPKTLASLKVILSVLEKNLPELVADCIKYIDENKQDFDIEFSLDSWNYMIQQKVDIYTNVFKPEYQETLRGVTDALAKHSNPNLRTTKL